MKHTMPSKTKKVYCRYGEERLIVDHGHGVYTMSGKCGYYRAGNDPSGKGIAFFDPSGGPFIGKGEMGVPLDEFGGRVVTDIIIESAAEGHFKITVETEEPA
jgi:hypothetical protein